MKSIQGATRGTLAGLALPNCKSYHWWHNTRSPRVKCVRRLIHQQIAFGHLNAFSKDILGQVHLSLVLYDHLLRFYHLQLPEILLDLVKCLCGWVLPLVATPTPSLRTSITPIRAIYAHNVPAFATSSFVKATFSYQTAVARPLSL